MINVPPFPTYDYANEAEFRRRVEQADTQNLKPTQSITSFLMTNDDGSVYQITLVGGVLTATAL